ncbi:DUF5719 family protein [Mobiluncus mulieris]|uniref:DUF5719 family protein n=1 Tax=Mobiluncus mulieris TaxID=2052 RepID=UPI0021E2A219|nr:DUF5719 family protein [Mobiluncus mulieris]
MTNSGRNAVGKAREPRAGVQTLKMVLHWGLGTVLVWGMSLALVVFAWKHPVATGGVRYGEPVPVPAAEVVLSCPAVPPTVNPEAVDAAGQRVAPPQIAGSLTATVLARSGKVPTDAVFSPLVDSVHEVPAATPTASAAPTSVPKKKSRGKDNDAQTESEPPEDTRSDLVLRPRSAMLFGRFSKPVSGFLRAAPWENRAALAAADIEQSVSSGDYRGLATGTCQVASQDVWLVGGATIPGNSTVLQLMNPSANPVEAKVEVWGDTGKQRFPRGEKLRINPKDQVSIPLESALPSLQSLAVHVSASGAGVAASLMTHNLQGLTAGGVSLVHASVAPGRTQVIPGVAMSEDLGAVRILNPGSETTHASIEVVNENGRFPLPGGAKVTLDAGTVTDFTLGGLQAGNYAVVVTSPDPVVAGAVVYRHGGESEQDPGRFRRDHAWLPALSPGGGVVLGPAAINRQLLVTNLGEADSEFKVAGHTHVVKAGTTAVVPLTEEAADLVEAPDLYVTQVLTTELGDGLGIDSLEPSPDLAQSRQVYVQLRS